MESKFWSVFSPGPTLDAMGKYLPIGDIVSLSRTCRALSGIYHELLPQQWSLDRLLLRFVSAPRTFREQIGLAEALIAGSFALEFFERPPWEADNLDIVVRDAAGMERLCVYLEQSDDYVRLCDPVTAHSGLRFRHISRVVVLKQNSDPGAKEIRLYENYPHAFPVKSILEGAWTTSLVNFISWRKAYSFFPLPTFLHSKSYLLHPCISVDHPDITPPLPVQKYRDRGFVFDVRNSALQGKKRHPMQKFRRAGDKFTWRISLNVKDMKVPPMLDPVLEEEYIYISQEASFFSLEDHALLGDTAGAADDCPNTAYHYETKFMRYNGFFT